MRAMAKTVGDGDRKQMPVRPSLLSLYGFSVKYNLYFNSWAIYSLLLLLFDILYNLKDTTFMNINIYNRVEWGR